MKDEIKEILDYLNIKGKKMIGIKQKELLLDYITNLQEENKEQKKQLESLIAQLELYKDNKEYLNNKIDKAIEYINKNKLDFEKWETQMILNILQGKSDE